ncbi:CLUMA_CG008754, isoform A [Clunio marinus]|uniref:CLUMA_CG008754, isoform A n=1 Tax=Clunio marinus TaxID=568069 RepID=A0A1J1I6I6_9DIPT|nr:CLUMA_CG008754, isoform A [Clunio marinus]
MCIHRPEGLLFKLTSKIIQKISPSSSLLHFVSSQTKHKGKIDKAIKTQSQEKNKNTQTQ